MLLTGWNIIAVKQCNQPWKLGSDYLKASYSTPQYNIKRQRKCSNRCIWSTTKTCDSQRLQVNDRVRQTLFKIKNSCSYHMIVLTKKSWICAPEKQSRTSVNSAKWIMDHDINQIAWPHWAFHSAKSESKRQSWLQVTHQRFQPVPEIQQNRFF